MKCFDSDSEWIKEIMRTVDQKKQNSDPKALPSQNAKMPEKQ